MNPLDAVREAIAEVLHPAHFFAAPHPLPLSPTGRGVGGEGQLEWEHLPVDQTPWEILRGQLVPRHLARELQVFESWNVFVTQGGQRSDEPLLSLKLDAEGGRLHVVRGLLCWTWEGYHAGDNVYLSREIPRWVRELVGTLEFAGPTPKELREELALWVFRAVVGLSRLPLTSVEAPLPGFSLGELAYFYNPDRSQTLEEREPVPLTSWRQLPAIYRRAWDPQVQTKWLEFLLRSVPASEVAEAAAACVQHWQEHGQDAADTLALLRAVFNAVALSPYTDFVDKSMAVLHRLVETRYLTAEQHVDFLGWLLRQLARHLTAYDLVTFHHRGANYPDALLLDAALKDNLRLLEQHPPLFTGDDRGPRLRRRALRLAWLHRRRYEGHPVPDAPTSPGENVRVLPPPHVRVPDEQILNLGKRTKRLYVADRLCDHVGANGLGILQQCGRDLQRDAELRELGMALFIERPLAAVKAPGEPDLSPLLAHEAYCPSLAERALMELAREPLMGLSADDVAGCRAVLARPWPAGGIPASVLPTEPPRVVSLADATEAASDFVILRTLPASVRAFCDRPDVAALLQGRGIHLAAKERWLIVANVTASGKPGVLIRDAHGKRVLQLEVDASQQVKAVTKRESSLNRNP